MYALLHLPTGLYLQRLNVCGPLNPIEERIIKFYTIKDAKSAIKSLLAFYNYEFPVVLANHKQANYMARQKCFLRSTAINTCKEIKFTATLKVGNPSFLRNSSIAIHNDGTCSVSRYLVSSNIRKRYKHTSRGRKNIFLTRSYYFLIFKMLLGLFNGYERELEGCTDICGIGKISYHDFEVVKLSSNTN